MFQQRPGEWPKITLPIVSETESPIKIRAARAAAREYVLLLRDALDIGQGDPSLAEEADQIEKHLDYLDEEVPA